MVNKTKNSASIAVKTADNYVENKENSSSDKNEPRLTGRLEVRLPPDVERTLLDLLANNTRTKSEVIIRLIKNHRLYYHLTEQETEVFLTLKECRDAFIKLKNALSSFSEKERLKFFYNNPDFMEEWVNAANQCIEQWDRIIRKLSE